jgi:hypothetical protein
MRARAGGIRTGQEEIDDRANSFSPVRPGEARLDLSDRIDERRRSRQPPAPIHSGRRRPGPPCTHPCTRAGRRQRSEANPAGWGRAGNGPRRTPWNGTHAPTDQEVAGSSPAERATTSRQVTAGIRVIQAGPPSFPGSVGPHCVRSVRRAGLGGVRKAISHRVRNESSRQAVARASTLR